MIKKYNDGNEYYFANGMWIRNFTKSATPIDINNITEQKDYRIIVENEIKNSAFDISEIDANKIKHKKAIIISDGFDFANKQKIILDIPNDVLVICTNRSLSKWRINKKVDYFVVNNPYKECMNLLPKHKYYPSCLISSRTNYEFVNEYDKRGGSLYKYSSTPEENFSSSINKSICVIDDYRNPICAAIGLCYKFGVSKLMLFCCDSSYNTNQPSSEKLNIGLWIYPQQKISHDIIDGNLYWYKKRGAVLADHSSGPEYQNVNYINENDIVEFFK